MVLLFSEREMCVYLDNNGDYHDRGGMMMTLCEDVTPNVVVVLLVVVVG